MVLQAGGGRSGDRGYRRKGAEVRGRVVTWMKARSGCQQLWGSTEDGDITTWMGHIWWDRRERQRSVDCVWNRIVLLQNHTHLDCGSVSVVSFNSSSETSVSRISGLDLFPYLTHKYIELHGSELMTDYLQHHLCLSFRPEMDKRLGSRVKMTFGTFDVCCHLVASTEITVDSLSCMKQKDWH